VARLQLAFFGIDSNGKRLDGINATRADTERGG
jgi:hypothetical protein